MATTEPVTDAATTPPKPSVNKGGRPSKAAIEARERAKHDPLATVEGDKSLDKPPEYPPDSKYCVPRPPTFRFGSDQPSPRRPEHFFQWWSGLPQRAKDSTIAYVYRNYPVIQIRTPDTKSPTGFKLTSQIDKRSGAEPLTSMDDVLHHYGSGNYTIRFNQSNPSKAICMCIIQGLRDEQHPPVVDPNTLAIEDPANRPYIEGLRMKGIRVPGVEPMEDEMQGGAAMDRMAGTIERLAQQNAQLSNRPERAEGNKPVDQTIVAQALSTGMGIVADANKMQNKMLSDTLDKIGQLKSEAGSGGNQADPLAVLDKVSSVIKNLMPAAAAQPAQPAGPSISDKLLESAMLRSDALEKRIHEMQTAQLSFFQQQLTKAQEAPAAAAAAAGKKPTADGSAPATPLEMLRELVKLKDGLGSLTGEGDRADNPAGAGGSGGPWWASLLQNLPSLVQMAVGISTMYAVASYNNAVAKTGQGQPTPVAAPAVPTLGETDANRPDELAPPPANDNTPLPTPGDPTMNAYHQFLAQLEKPLRLSLENDETGDAFAEKLIQFHGQVAYDLLHNLGRDQVIQILSTYPPIWRVVVAIPQKFQQFLDEFMAYGEAPEPPDPGPQPVPPTTGSSPGVKAHAARAGGGKPAKPQPHPHPPAVAPGPPTQ